MRVCRESYESIEIEKCSQNTIDHLLNRYGVGLWLKYMDMRGAAQMSQNRILADKNES